MCEMVGVTVVVFVIWMVVVRGPPVVIGTPDETVGVTVTVVVI
jgi:hypothetical protein